MSIQVHAGLEVHKQVFVRLLHAVIILYPTIGLVLWSLLCRYAGRCWHREASTARVGSMIDDVECLWILIGSLHLFCREAKLGVTIPTPVVTSATEAYVLLRERR